MLLDPWLRTRAVVLDAGVEAAQAISGEVHAHWQPGRMPDARVEELLPRSMPVLGRSHLPVERLARTPRLEAVVGLEGNCEPFVHYAACRASGVEVVSIAPAMAPAVAAWVPGAILGRLRAGIDVFPEEPVPADAMAWRAHRVLPSTHSSGGTAPGREPRSEAALRRPSLPLKTGSCTSRPPSGCDIPDKPESCHLHS